MTEKIHEKGGVFVPPPNSQNFSYVVSITLPQPTIRIKIPKVLVKAMQRRNQTRIENDENGSKKNKKKYWGTSKKSFRNKVGSIFSNVFGKKSVSETDSKSENGEEMKKLKNMIERVDNMEWEKITRKSSEEDMLMVGAGNERKKRPKCRRTYSETLCKRNELLSKGKNNNVVDDSIVGNIDLNVACVGDKDGIVSLKKEEDFNDLSGFGSKTVTSSHRKKLKTAWWMKKMTSVVMGGKKSGKQELCKKRILMGGRCRPLNDSG